MCDELYSVCATVCCILVAIVFSLCKRKQMNSYERNTYTSNDIIYVLKLKVVKLLTCFTVESLTKVNNFSPSSPLITEHLPIEVHFHTTV